MALNAATIWEYRATATASNVNGGGFVPGSGGTDYSQQDATQLALTDLASTDPWTTVTSSTGGFTDAMVGNLIHITAATGSVTAGWYEIKTRVNTNTITVDRATGTGNWTGGTGRVGGALALPSSASLTAMVPGNIAYIKSGTYSPGASISDSTAGTAELRKYFYGYKTTRGDIPRLEDRPTITMGAYQFTTHNYHSYSNIIFSGTGNVVAASLSYAYFYNCKWIGTKAGGYGLYANSYYPNVIACEFTNPGGYGLMIDWGPALVWGNYIHDSSVGLFIHDANNIMVAFNILSGNTTAAIDLDYANVGNLILNNILYGAETPTAVGLRATVGHQFILMNNIFYGFATGASMTTAYQDCFVDYNNWYNNTADVSNFTKGSHDIAINPQFVNPAAKDFRIGRNMKSKGFPDNFVNMGCAIGTAGLLDLGALQYNEIVRKKWY